MKTQKFMEQEFWTNKKGEKVHVDMIPHTDKLKTELVYDLVDRAQRGVNLLTRFKQGVVKSIDEYMQMMRERYHLDVSAGTKGNLTLQSFDGLKKVQIAVQQYIDFDEKLNLAKEKIDIYLKEITKDTDPAIQTLIMKAFEVDKKGNIDAKKILSLKSYKIEHPQWQEAMKLIDDAVEIVGSKSYIRFYTREGQADRWQAVSLDFAAV